VSVGVERGYDQKQSHTCIEEDSVAVEILPVPEEEPDKNGGNICEPQKIGDDKVFTERDIVVQWKVDHMVGLAGAAFQPDKPGNIHCEIQDCPRMRIFF